MREAGPPAAADPIALEVTMVTAVGTFEEVARASQDIALAFLSLPALASFQLPLVPVLRAWMMMCCINLMLLIGCLS